MQSIRLILFNDFLKMEPIIPNIQRGLSKDRIDELIERETEHYRKYKAFSFDMSAITLCRINDALYIIDGQHRYKAAQFLAKNNSFNVLLNIFTVKDEKEMNELFLKINESLPIKISKEINEHIMANNIIKHYVEKYPSFFKTTDKPQKPNLKRERFEKKIMRLAADIKDEKEIMKYINRCNKDIKKLYESGEINLTEKQEKKVKKHQFYLGAVDNWEEPGDKKDTGKIPKYIRDRLWEKTFGDKLHGKCCMCDEKISMNNFEAGHKISRKNGGPDTINNLIPMCGRCNKSLGSKNLNI